VGQSVVPDGVQAGDTEGEIVAHNWGMIELIEAAVRIGAADLAAGALERLTTVTAFSSGWLSFPQLGADN
jgi:hypothetical protein